MNPRRSLQRKVIYLVVIALLLVPLFWLGRPATYGSKDTPATDGGVLAQLRKEYQLSQAQLGEIDPASETIKLATLGMRGVATIFLWEKANRYKMRKDWTRMRAAVDQMVKLEPNFTAVWRFQGWTLSYNVSVEFDDYRQRYRWVIEGINFLRDGIKYNEYEPILFWDIGWFLSHKIGRADEHRQYRRLLKEDDDFCDSLPPSMQDPSRDNWLLGKLWFEKADDLASNQGKKMKGMGPLVYRANAPLCQMKYAEALEADGTFGEKARQAWKEAAREWTQYGNAAIRIGDGEPFRLSDGKVEQERADKLGRQIDALAPELREKIVAERRATFSEEERQAVAILPDKRTEKQERLAFEAEARTRVSHEEVARRVKGPNRDQARKLGKQATKAEELARTIRRYREFVNFDYWQLRAEVEQDDDTLAARELIYDGGQNLAEGKLDLSRDQFDRGLAAWRKVLDRYPAMIADAAVGLDMADVINDYRRLLDQRDEPFPADFVLQDVLDQLTPR